MSPSTIPSAIRARVTVRAGVAADLPYLTSLLERVENFSPAERAVAREVIEAALRDEIGADYALLCAVPLGGCAAPGVPVGFAVFGPTSCTEGTWDLYWIAVDPAGKNRGTGSALLAAVEAACVRRAARILKVETASKASYDATRTFYERRKYVVEARIKDFYAPGDDLVVYVKRWNGARRTNDESGMRNDE